MPGAATNVIDLSQNGGKTAYFSELQSPLASPAGVRDQISCVFCPFSAKKGRKKRAWCLVLALRVIIYNMAREMAYF